MVRCRGVFGFLYWTALLLGISAFAKTPKNIILFIGDGMGMEQLEVGRIYLSAHEFVLDTFPAKGKVTTCNIHGTLKNGSCDPNASTVTDSAAAATAIATGNKVSNGVLSLAEPGDRSPLSTILEKMKRKKKSTGLVTTCLSTDATPAAFGAHVVRRAQAKDIGTQYFAASTPNVIFGASWPFMKAMAASSPAKYKVVDSLTGLNTFQEEIRKGKWPCKKDRCPHVLGAFGSYPLLPTWEKELGGTMPLEASGDTAFKAADVPHLSEMAKAAVDVLAQNKNGFFLMVESGLIDWIGHKYPFFKDQEGEPKAVEALAKEMKEANETLRYLTAFTKAHPDTLLVVTADHETGGLKVKKDETLCLGKKGCIPSVEWTSPVVDAYGGKFAEHTKADVAVFATGTNAQLFDGKMDNTEFSKKMLSAD